MRHPSTPANPSRRLVTALVVGALLAVASGPALADGRGHSKGRDKKKPPAPAPKIPCTGEPSAIRDVHLIVEGQGAYGLVAYPRSRPRALVVFFHGYGHTVESWREHITRTARDEGVVAVVMDYRGTIYTPPAAGSTRPGSRGWRVAEGAADSIAVAQHLDRACGGFPTVVAHSISMGGNAAGLALAAKPMRSGGKPLFDFWVNIEGAANVTETYNSASLIAPANEYATNAKADIEAEMGGTFAEKSDTYAERTVVNRIDDIVESGLRGVIVVHGAADGLVPYNQSRELAALLRAHQVPVEFRSVVTKGSTSEAGTTIDGYVGGEVPGYESPFAGHASEASTTHLIQRIAFDRLHRLLIGEAPTCAELLHDGTTGLAGSGTFTDC